MKPAKLRPRKDLEAEAKRIAQFNDRVLGPFLGIEPAEVPPGVDDLLTFLSGKDRKTTIESGACTTCDTPDMNFRTPADRSEYQISGMCQKCIDVAFAEPEDDDEQQQ